MCKFHLWKHPNLADLLWTLIIHSQLVRFKPNFVKDRVKELYSEIWGLDVSADGNTVFTAWNNSILVSDLGGSYSFTQIL